MQTETEVEKAVADFLESWAAGGGAGAKQAFMRFVGQLGGKEDVSMSFISRPGVSHSLRAFGTTGESGSPRLFALIDVIDDDPSNRWLSVCFYEKMITDPEEKGDLVPGGLLGEDGYCFDVAEDGLSDAAYVAERIDEAYGFSRNAA